jgi:hypothetical protein
MRHKMRLLPEPPFFEVTGMSASSSARPQRTSCCSADICVCACVSVYECVRSMSYVCGSMSYVCARVSVSVYVCVRSMSYVCVCTLCDRVSFKKGGCQMPTAVKNFYTSKENCDDTALPIVLAHSQQTKNFINIGGADA